MLDNIALFLTIVEKGSLTAAGREAGLSPATVSERLAALEAHFGVVLLNPTTRAISLTDEGRTLDNLWQFGIGAEKQMITVHGDRIANDSGLVREWCVAGFGVARKSELDVAEDLKDGRLVDLLAGDAVPPTPLHLIFPPSRAQPRRVRALADHLQDRVRA